MIKIHPVKAFSDNYIWCLYDDVSRKAVIIDPGDASPVLETLSTLELDLAAILITHHHMDHIGGVSDLLSKYSVPVHGPDSDNIPFITNQLGDTDSLNILGLKFDVLTVPGHTLDHIAFYCESSDIGPFVFCGDTLFAGGCGRIFEGDPKMMLASLEKLAELPASTKIFCAHEYTLANLTFAKAVEPANLKLQQRIKSDSDLRNQDKPTIPSTLSNELATNPFLRCKEQSVMVSANSHADKDLSDTVEVFAVIRGWKDNF